MSPDVHSLETVKLVAEHVRDSPHLLLVRTHLPRTFSVVSAEFQTQCCASSHVRFKSVALCHQVCFVRLRIDTCKSRFDILHDHGLQHTLVWMPIPSQIDCRHGSRESLRIPVLSRGVSSPSLRQSQLSRRTVLLRRNSSLLTVVFATMQRGCTTPPLVLSQVVGCPAQSLSEYTLTDCGHVLISIKHFALGTLFQVSCDAIHVHLVAFSRTGCFVLFPTLFA